MLSFLPLIITLLSAFFYSLLLISVLHAKYQAFGRESEISHCYQENSPLILLPNWLILSGFILFLLPFRKKAPLGFFIYLLNITLIGIFEIFHSINLCYRETPMLYQLSCIVLGYNFLFFLECMGTELFIDDEDNEQLSSPDEKEIQVFLPQKS